VTSLPNGGVIEGKNSWIVDGWGGPLPPKGGGPHRYRFRVYALDTKLALNAGVTKAELFAAMEGRSVGEGELDATYER
jgi:Raf kinase inhibitor-like YbhB/YbcL family protein